MDTVGKLVKDNTTLRPQAQAKSPNSKAVAKDGAGQLEAMKNVGAVLSDTNSKFQNGKVNKLKSNGTFRKLNALFGGTQLGQKPMTRILNAISKWDYDGLNVVISELISGYSTQEYRKENPVLYALADLIFPTLGDMMGIGNESGLSDEGNICLQNGSFDCENFENVADGIIETLMGLISTREVEQLVRKADGMNPDNKKKLDKYIERTEDMGGDNFVDPEAFDQVDFDVSEVLEAYMARTHRYADNNAEHYVKQLSGAKSAAKLNGTKYIQNSVTKVGQGYVGVGSGVYDNLAKIGRDLEGGDWRGRLNAILDAHGVQYQAVTQEPVQGNYPKEKFVSVSGSAAVWNKAEGKIKEAVNGAG